MLKEWNVHPIPEHFQSFMLLRKGYWRRSEAKFCEKKNGFAHSEPETLICSFVKD